MNQLKTRNPQAFQIVEQARNNNGNPMDLFKQMTSNYTPEQMDSLFSKAKQMGIPDDVLQQVQNNDVNAK